MASGGQGYGLDQLAQYGIPYAEGLRFGGAFRRCKKPSDWLRPTPAPKDWVSKVDWTGCDRVVPEAEAKEEGFRLEAMDEEIRAGTEHDVLLAKAKAKMDQFTVAPVDKINDPLAAH